MSPGRRKGSGSRPPGHPQIAPKTLSPPFGVDAARAGKGGAGRQRPAKTAGPASVRISTSSSEKLRKGQRGGYLHWRLPGAVMRAVRYLDHGVLRRQVGHAAIRVAALPVAAGAAFPHEGLGARGRRSGGRGRQTGAPGSPHGSGGGRWRGAPRGIPCRNGTRDREAVSCSGRTRAGRGPRRACDATSPRSAARRPSRQGRHRVEPSAGAVRPQRMQSSREARASILRLYRSSETARQASQARRPGAAGWRPQSRHKPTARRALPAASGGLPVPLGGKRPAVRAAAAAGNRRGLAALDTERAVGLPAAAVDPGAVGPPARGEAVVAARIAFGRRPVPALYAEAGLFPFLLALLQAPAAEREMFLVAGVAEPPAGFLAGGAAFLAEAAVAPKQAAFAGGLAVAGAAALLAFRGSISPRRAGKPCHSSNRGRARQAGPGHARRWTAGRARPRWHCRRRRCSNGSPPLRQADGYERGRKPGMGGISCWRNGRGSRSHGRPPRKSPRPTLSPPCRPDRTGRGGGRETAGGAAAQTRAAWIRTGIAVREARDRGSRFLDDRLSIAAEKFHSTFAAGKLPPGSMRLSGSAPGDWTRGSRGRRGARGRAREAGNAGLGTGARPAPAHAMAGCLWRPGVPAFSASGAPGRAPSRAPAPRGLRAGRQAGRQRHGSAMPGAHGALPARHTPGFPLCARRPPIPFLTPAVPAALHVSGRRFRGALRRAPCRGAGTAASRPVAPRVAPMDMAVDGEVVSGSAGRSWREAGMSKRFAFDEAGVEALEPGDREWRAWDEALKGFGVRIRPSGGKSWIVNATVRGADGRVRSRRITLGRCGEMSLEEARTEARKHLGVAAPAVAGAPAADMEDRGAGDRAPAPGGPGGGRGRPGGRSGDGAGRHSRRRGQDRGVEREDGAAGGAAVGGCSGSRAVASGQGGSGARIRGGGGVRRRGRWCSPRCRSCPRRTPAWAGGTTYGSITERRSRIATTGPGTRRRAV